jgi:hypothetical protein
MWTIRSLRAGLADEHQKGANSLLISMPAGNLTYGGGLKGRQAVSPFEAASKTTDVAGPALWCERYR